MLNTMFIPPRDPSQLVLHLVPGPRNRLNSTGTKQRACFVSLSLTPPSESCTQPLPRTQRWVPRRANRIVLTTTQSYGTRAAAPQAGQVPNRYQRAAGRTARRTKSPAATERSPTGPNAAERLAKAASGCCCQDPPSLHRGVNRRVPKPLWRQRVAGQPSAAAPASDFWLLPCRKVTLVTHVLLATSTKRDLPSCLPSHQLPFFFSTLTTYGPPCTHSRKWQRRVEDHTQATPSLCPISFWKPAALVSTFNTADDAGFTHHHQSKAY